MYLLKVDSLDKVHDHVDYVSRNEVNNTLGSLLSTEDIFDEGGIIGKMKKALLEREFHIVQ